MDGSDIIRIQIYRHLFVCLWTNTIGSSVKLTPVTSGWLVKYQLNMHTKKKRKITNHFKSSYFSSGVKG